MSDNAAVGAFKRAAKFLIDPIPAGLLMLPDLLDELSPDLSLLTFQPLSVLATQETESRESQRSAPESRRSSSPTLETSTLSAAPRPNGSAPADVLRQSVEFPIFSMGRRGHSTNGVTPENGTSEYPSLADSPRFNRPVPPVTSSLTGNRTIDALIDAGLADQSNWLIETGESPSETSQSGEIRTFESNAKLPPIEGQSAPLQRTIELIEVLATRILNQPASADVIRQSGGTPPISTSDPVSNRAISPLPPLTTLIRPSGDFPAPAESVRVNPFPYVDSLSHSLDADAITDLVNQVLVEQARRYGVDLS